MDHLYRIVARHFVAGVVASHTGVIVETAPIMSYARHKTVLWLQALCARRGWLIAEVKS